MLELKLQGELDVANPSSRRCGQKKRTRLTAGPSRDRLSLVPSCLATGSLIQGGGDVVLMYRRGGKPRTSLEDKALLSHMPAGFHGDL